jgi:hypothetical protein
LNGRAACDSAVISFEYVRSLSNNRSIRAPSSSSTAMSVVSSLNDIERLSKFTVPADTNRPSATMDLACIIAGWYSKMRTPCASSVAYIARPA